MIKKLSIYVLFALMAGTLIFMALKIRSQGQSLSMLWGIMTTIDINMTKLQTAEDMRKINETYKVHELPKIELPKIELPDPEIGYLREEVSALKLQRIMDSLEIDSLRSRVSTLESYQKR